ncbi:MAG: molybdate ABC transporter substrate-binding protein [Acidobacteriota bacterium]
MRRARRSAAAIYGAAAACLALAALTMSCAPAGPEPAPGRQPLRVFAAASLTEVVGELEALYGSRVLASFGSSSALARQIRDGAPADVFLSASPQWIDFLRQAGALDGEPKILARNRLVTVTSKSNSRLMARPPQTLRQLLDSLDPGDGVAIADAGVPAGEYARAALRGAGLLGAFEPLLVGQSDVRAALNLAERGELPAAFVYATDAAIADVEVLWTLDAADHPPIEYQAAALAGSSDLQAASAFVAFLGSEPARSLLAEAGFLLP